MLQALAAPTTSRPSSAMCNDESVAPLDAAHAASPTPLADGEEWVDGRGGKLARGAHGPTSPPRIRCSGRPRRFLRHLRIDAPNGERGDRLSRATEDATGGKASPPPAWLCSRLGLRRAGAPAAWRSAPTSQRRLAADDRRLPAMRRGRHARADRCTASASRDVLHAMLPGDPRPWSDPAEPGRAGPRLAAADRRPAGRPAVRPDDAPAVQATCDDPRSRTGSIGLPAPYSARRRRVVHRRRAAPPAARRARAAGHHRRAPAASCSAASASTCSRTRQAAEIGYLDRGASRAAGA